jgi:DNA-binding GntR family transcriptional regulator
MDGSGRAAPASRAKHPSVQWLKASSPHAVPIQCAASYMALKKIQKHSAEKLAADAIREYILGGQIAPGARLTEIHLAERFSLSRATIRGAMQRMVQEGLLVLVPYVGWEVMSITSHDAWELYTLRQSLEALAARLASERIDEKGKATLKAAYQKLVEASAARNLKDVSAADFKLHRAIIELSGHTRLAHQYQLIEQQISLYIFWSDFMPSNESVYQVVLDHHGPIVEAILAGNSETAARLAAEHNIDAGLKLVHHLEQLEAERAKAA